MRTASARGAVEHWSDTSRGDCEVGDCRIQPETRSELLELRRIAHHGAVTSRDAAAEDKYVDWPARVQQLAQRRVELRRRHVSLPFNSEIHVMVQK